MAREYKFRGWDGESKTMLPVQDLSQSSEYWAWLGKKDVKLMQYTGLKDKNGNEIYEGDIAKYTMINPFLKEHIELIHEVKFQNCSFYPVPGELLFGYFDFEIIGNIYENPELLDG